MNDEHLQKPRMIQTALAVPLAIMVWIAVYVLAYMALGLLDNLRGLKNDGLQILFRELFTPGVGGYAAIFSVNYWLTRAHLKFVLWAFCTPVFLFMIGLPIIMLVFFLPEGWTFTWSEQVTRWLGGAATLLGAWLAYRKFSRRHP